MSGRLFDLDGRTALVTGSSKGIGHAIAEGLLEAGAHVVLNGRNADTLETARIRLEAAFGDDLVSASAFDVTDPDAVTAAVDAIEAKTGPIDILVNNAGMQLRVALEDCADENWRELMATNVDSVFYVGKAVARHMIGRGRGKIINIASIMSELGRPGVAAYTASKGAVKMLTKGMCIDWGRHGIQVNGIGPGYFRTEMTEALVNDLDFDAWLRAHTPAGRWGDLPELKGAAIFLASDASSFVNGHILYVDGGITATL